jgi:hypothetical protein
MLVCRTCNSENSSTNNENITKEMFGNGRSRFLGSYLCDKLISERRCAIVLRPMKYSTLPASSPNTLNER